MIARRIQIGAGPGFSAALLLFVLAAIPLRAQELSPTDLERVKVGSVAPDFSLPDISGRKVSLSYLRGKSNVILVFYRGQW